MQFYKFSTEFRRTIANFRQNEGFSLKFANLW